MPNYKGARLKIKRADKHGADLKDVIELPKEKVVVTANVAEQGHEFIKCDFASPGDREFFDELPLVVGDAVHNFRCALDHAWLETVERLLPSKDWKRTKFPCFQSRDEVEGALRNLQIDADAPNLFRLLMDDIQPYDGGDFAIRVVHALDIRDKHLLLIPVVQYSSIGGIYVKDQDGKLHRADTWGTTKPFPHFIELVKGLHIENPGRPAFEVMFQYGARETRAVDTLRYYSQCVSHVVERLEGLIEP